MSNDLAKQMKLDKIAFKKKQIEEERQKIKEERNKVKEEKVKAMEEKVKEKMKAREDAKNAKENIVLSVMCCTQLLKKGGTCKQKQHTGTLCLKHHNITIALGTN